MSIFKRVSIPSFVALLLLAMIFWWGRSTPTPFLSLFTSDSHFNLRQTSLFLGSMGIFRVLLQPMLGMSMNRFSEIMAIKLALILMCVSNLGLFLLHPFWMLIACRGLEAAGISLFMISIRLLIKSNDHKKMTLLNNYYTGIKNFASFLAPSVAGFFLAYSSSRIIFLLGFSVFLTGLLVAFTLQHKSIHFEACASTQIKSHEKRSVLGPLFGLSLPHSLEFVALGLWLSGWVLYAHHTLGWSESRIGLSYSVVALAGIIVVPLLNQKMIRAIPSHYKLLGGLLLLIIQPACVVLSQQPIVLWLAFFVGGAGASIYFSSFHMCVATHLEKKNIAVFYGFLGSITFLGLSAGQALAPLLWKNSYKLPIVADLLALLTALFIYCIIFYIKKPFMGIQHERI